MPLADHRAVYIVDGVRTPFLRASGPPGPFSARELASRAMRALLERQPRAKEALDEVVLGCVLPALDEVNIARQAALLAGIDKKVPALSVNRVCGSGMQAVDTAARNIALGETRLALAGGVESMSHAPVAFNRGMATFLSLWERARDWKAKLKVLASFRPDYLKPVKGMACALSDTLENMSMGQTAEVIARRFAVSREEMDAFALASHRRAAAAWDGGRFAAEVLAIEDAAGRAYARDTGIRADSSPEKLARLRPAFEKGGAVTAGNSSQITDGAAVLLLAGEEAVRALDLPVLGRINDCAWAGNEPREMGLGPAYAIAKLARRNRLAADAVDFWEINEAFAAQVLACLAAWRDDDYCRKHLDRERGFAPIPESRLNVDGGGISLGHPVGVSGARIVLHLTRTLRRNHARLGVASLCIGGGQGGAMLIEAIQE